MSLLFLDEKLLLFFKNEETSFENGFCDVKKEVKAGLCCLFYLSLKVEHLNLH